MKVLVFAAKGIGLRCLEGLRQNFADDDYFVVACEPDQGAILDFARDWGVLHKALEPEVAEILSLGPAEEYDWLLNLWGGIIFRPALLARAKRSLNIHPSYLPTGRGRDPVVWAIREQIPAGVTLHSIVPEVDAGPIWYREEIPYAMPIRGVELYERVTTRCWQVFIEQWPALRARTSPPEPQGEGPPAHLRKELFADRDLDYDDPSVRKVVLTLLAHDFLPDYGARIRIEGCLYEASIALKPITE
jgi:methionyl-tRNA formyltransferase